MFRSPGSNSKDSSWVHNVPYIAKVLAFQLEHRQVYVELFFFFWKAIQRDATKVFTWSSTTPELNTGSDLAKILHSAKGKNYCTNAKNRLEF